MSDHSHGPGWWQASDGKWYAPELHPSAVSIPTVPTVHPSASNPTAAWTTRDGQGRRWWLLAIPVVAACTVIAIVLSLTLGGSTSTSASASTSRSTSNSTATSTSTSTSTSSPTSVPHAGAGATDLSGTYVGVGEDNSLTMLLELTQSGSALTGTLIVSGSHYAPTLGDKPGQVAGTVDLASKSFAGRVAAFGLSFSGNVSGTSLTLSFSRFGDPEDENVLNIVFQHGTVPEFHQLTSKSAPSVANAQVNLVNAVTAARAFYQISRSYTGPDHSYEPDIFTQRLPQFVWTTKECSTEPVNCISLRFLDVGSNNDGQGIALAVYSAKTSSCWYAIDIETTPKVLPNDRAAFVTTANDPNVSVTHAGVYYARSPVGSAPSFCTAYLVLNPHQAAWGTDYANAGAIS